MAGWLDSLRSRNGQKTPEQEKLSLPLFPLGTVLFPGGILSLKVFEARYLDMVSACLRNKTLFGVCLIASGQEVGAPAVPHAVGTTARIIEADMPQPGILMLKAQGQHRFRVLSSTAQADGLLNANVEILNEARSQPIPDTQRGLLPLLQRVATDLGPDKMPEPHAFDDAAWVGCRLTEILPVQPLAKQKLLELDDPIARLEILHAYLAQRGLVE